MSSTFLPQPCIDGLCNRGSIHDLSTPWGAEAIYDGDATIELCAAVDAQFTRCNFCGAWAGDLGLINRDFAHTMRRKAALRLDDLKLFHFITSEGEVYLNDRTTADIADSLLFNCLPDAMVIGGSAAGRGASGELADEVRERVGQVPVCVAPVVAKIPWLTYLLTTMARLSARA